MRSPVISTTVGTEGLPVQHDRHLLLADSAEQFADTVLSLLNDPGKKRAVAAEGYDFVRSNYSWIRIGKQLHDVCLGVCEKARR